MDNLLWLILFILLFCFSATGSYFYHTKKETGNAAVLLFIACFMLALLVVLTDALVADKI